MKGEISEHEWFIEPIGAFTNAKIFPYVKEERAAIGKMDDEGKPHEVYETTPDVLTKLVESRKTAGLRFKIFSCRKGAPVIRNVGFLYFKRHTRPSKPKQKKAA